MFAITRFCWSRFSSILFYICQGKEYCSLYWGLHYDRGLLNQGSTTTLWNALEFLMQKLFDSLNYICCPCISESKKTWQVRWKNDKIWGHWCWLEQGICHTEKIGTGTQRVLVYWHGKLNLGVKETLENETRKKIIKWGTYKWRNLSIKGFVKIQLIVFSTN